LDGRSPVFLGSAIFAREDGVHAVHPCKVAPHLSPPARVPYAGGEYEHRERYDVLPFNTNTMEWVSTSGGRIPPGRRPVEGGYEEDGQYLYHALAVVEGVRVPGKTGPSLGAANIPFGGGEHVVDNYEILCWR